VTLYPNGMFYLRSDHLVALAASAQVAFEVDTLGSPYRVRVTNRDALALTVHRAAGGRHQLLGHALPGGAFIAELAGSPTQSPGKRPDYWPGRARLSLDETALRVVNAIVPDIRRDSILVVSHEGVFAPARQFARRNAVTVTVIEVPDPGEE
jgi:hypothetical protein